MKRSFIASAFVVAAVVCTSLFAATPSQVLAETSEQEERIVTIYRESADDDVTADVTNALSDPSVAGVTVIDQWRRDSNYADEDSPIISPRSPYTLKNKRYTGRTRGSNKLAEASGGPGITLTIQKTVGASNTHSCASGVDAGTINACVGFNVTASESISVSGSYTVPSQLNGRNVSMGYLIAYPLYDCYSFDVYMSSYYLSSGTAKQAVGCTFLKTHTYA